MPEQQALYGPQLERQGQDMRISGKKYVITGAGRGLGAALAIVMAEAGCRLVLLVRKQEALDAMANIIRVRTGQKVDTLPCDLADVESCAAAGAQIAARHADLDGLIHNGAMWLEGPMDGVSDADIAATVGSAATGSLILTRHLLPVLKNRPTADIHVVVSTSGLHHRPNAGGSAAFRAAKFAQAGLVQGLTDELMETAVRVTSVFPSYFDDISPEDPLWRDQPTAERTLSNREVTGAILFMLNQPPQVAVRSMVME
jgi:NAD(P)-dependent dehydrogenase (short-subunit alcohol dehydrogenase family)